MPIVHIDRPRILISIERDGDTAKLRLRGSSILPRGNRVILDHADLRAFHEYRPTPS
jgi:hypothetical protein